MSETQDSILPCPICSAVVRNAAGQTKPIIFGPMFYFASMKSAREGTDFYVWDGCHHINGSGATSGTIVEAAMRSLTIARWNVHARKLYAEKITGWSEVAAHDFGKALGFA